MKYAICLMSLSIFSGNLHAADTEVGPPRYIEQPVPSAPIKASALEIQPAAPSNNGNQDSSVMIKDVRVDESAKYINHGSCHCCVWNFIYGEKPKDQ